MEHDRQLSREDLSRLAGLETPEIALLSDSDRELERRLRLRGEGRGHQASSKVDMAFDKW